MGAVLKLETVAVVGVALAVIYLAYKAKNTVGKAIDKVETVIPYVNPADDKNVVNQAATGLWQLATGSNGTIGSDIYDMTHGGVLSNGTFNPTSDNNIIYRNLTDFLGGDLGSKIYDWTH